MEVEVYGSSHSKNVEIAIVNKEVAFFNRLYFSKYLSENKTMDPSIVEEHRRMLLGKSGGFIPKPATPQKKRSISETTTTPPPTTTNNNNTTTTDKSPASSSKQASSSSVNTPPSKKKKVNPAAASADEEKKTPKIKVYTTSLFEKGLLVHGDTILFKHDDKKVTCTVNSKGELKVANADNSERKTSNSLRVVTQFITDAYSLSSAGKSKYWNLFFLVRKGAHIKLKSLREKYLVLLEHENDPNFDADEVVLQQQEKSNNNNHNNSTTRGEERETEKRGKRRVSEGKKSSRVLISQLVEAGLLEDGDSVVYKGQKNNCPGTITDSRYITYFDPNTQKEEQFETPNSFKSHIAELGNCWQQMVLKRGEKETSFQTLRDKYFE